MKKQLTLQQQIKKLEHSIKKFGDPHNYKIPILEKLKQQAKNNS